MIIIGASIPVFFFCLLQELRPRSSYEEAKLPRIERAAHQVCRGVHRACRGVHRACRGAASVCPPCGENETETDDAFFAEIRLGIAEEAGHSGKDRLFLAIYTVYFLHKIL